jgi:hypothetical protein
MKPTPTIGQTLYSLNVGNAARRVPQTLTPVIVTKVGRKYFTTGEGWQATQYHIGDWREKTDFSPNSHLYASEQEYADEKESDELCRRIGKAFEYGRNAKALPLEALRRIEGIILANTGGQP